MPTITTRDSTRMRELCIDRAPFKTHGAMWAGKVTSFTTSNRCGQLPVEYHWSYLGAEYAVYSYNTPIAWYGPDGWTKPEVGYSVTTTRHQNKLNFINDWIEKD